MNIATSALEDKKLLPALELSKVKALLIERLGWADWRAAIAESLYRMFLELHRRYPEERHALPADADEFWHIHILMTEKYRSDSVTILGRFLDHDPTAEISDKQRRSSEQRFLSEFGARVCCNANSY